MAFLFNVDLNHIINVPPTHIRSSCKLRHKFKHQHNPPENYKKITEYQSNQRNSDLHSVAIGGFCRGYKEKLHRQQIDVPLVLPLEQSEQIAKTQLLWFSHSSLTSTERKHSRTPEALTETSSAHDDVQNQRRY